MKLLSITFVALLSWSQMTLGADLTSRPLSMFRDGEFGLVGYALFTLLIMAGLVMVHTLSRLHRTGEAGVFAAAVALLFGVAGTPSFNALHETCAALLLLTLFAYYTVQLLLAKSGWLGFHLAAPVLLMPLLGYGYGPWQKGLIVYLLLLLNIHHHLLARQSAPILTGPRRGTSQKRRRIYVVEEGKAWTRRRWADSSCAS